MMGLPYKHFILASMVMAMASWSARAQNGPNTFGGYVRFFSNPTGPNGGNAGQTGDSILGDNDGYSATSFTAPPGANDTVVVEPIAASYLSGPDPNSFYTYPGLLQSSPAGSTYTIALSGTIAELIGTSGYNPAASQYSYENPVIQLAGSFTATDDTILSGLDSTNPLLIQGSGSLITANGLLAGTINITAGTVTATHQLIVGNDIPSYFGTNFYTGTTGVEEDTFYPTLTNTTVTFTGSSSVLNAMDYLVVGVATGTSTLQLMNGAQANTGAIYLADDTGANGDLVVNGSTLTSTGFLDVGEGNNTTAQVTISNGGKVSDTIGTIGFGNNAEASVTVTGAGSTWNNSGYIAVGYSSTNVDDTLTVSQGGAVNSAGFLAIGGQVQDGTSGSGSLYIMSGGDVISGTTVPSQTLAAAVGFGTNSTGTVLIDGSGSSWDVKQRLDVGYSSGSTGTITVQNGGTLQVEGDIIRLGNVQGSTGNLTFDGTGGNPTFTFTTANSNLYIGDEGTGNFTVQGGAQITESAAVTIGNESTATGTATVQGANSSWTINNSLMIGENGTGTLSILNGDQVTVDDEEANNVILGDQAKSIGTLILNGAGSALNVTEASSGSDEGDALEIGNHGVGKLQIQNGADINFNQKTDLGFHTDGQGQVSVDGIGSSAIFNSGLIVGSQATGSGGSAGGLLSVTGGGDVTVLGSSSAFVIGYFQGSTGEVDVDGSGSKLTVTSSAIDVGGGGMGKFVISNGGQVNAANSPLFIGLVATGGSYVSSEVDVNGTGGGASGGSQTQLISGAITIGQGSYGTLNATQGAQLMTTGDVTIGQVSFSSGTVGLNTQSSWNISGNLVDGVDGTANLTIGGGSTLKTQTLDIENGIGTAKLTVTGNSSTLLANTINMGSGNGTGTFSIQSGGQVSTQTFTFGDYNSTLTIDGSGSAASTLTTGTFTLGGNDTVTVSNGGLLTVNGASFQSSLGSTGVNTINITGSGSKLDAASAYTSIVGQTNINVLNGGTWATGQTDIQSGAIQLNSTGDTSTWNVTGPLSMVGASLSITNNSTVAVSQAASVDAGTLTLNGSGASFTAPSLQVAQGSTVKANGLSQINLTTTLSVNAHAVVDVTGGGSVQVGNPTKTPTGAVNIGASGQVINSGIIDGNVNINAGGGLIGQGVVSGTVNGTVNGNVSNAGTVAPNDPQTMTINGNYTQLATGNLVFALDGADSVDYDHLVVTGEISIQPGATLTLNFENGFAPTKGEIFNLVDYGTLDSLNADFSNLTLTGLAPGFDYLFTPVGTGGTDFQLTALNNGVATTTPEPSTWFLLITGLTLLACKLRRKSTISLVY